MRHSEYLAQAPTFDSICFEAITLIDAELVDTRGGNFTYKDVQYVWVGENVYFYDRTYGVNVCDSGWELVDDSDEIREYLMEVLRK